MTSFSDLDNKYLMQMPKAERGIRNGKRIFNK